MRSVDSAPRSRKMDARLIDRLNLKFASSCECLSGVYPARDEAVSLLRAQCTLLPLKVKNGTKQKMDEFTDSVTEFFL